MIDKLAMFAAGLCFAISAGVISFALFAASYALLTIWWAP